MTPMDITLFVCLLAPIGVMMWAAAASVVATAWRSIRGE